MSKRSSSTCSLLGAGDSGRSMGCGGVGCCETYGYESPSTGTTWLKAMSLRAIGFVGVTLVSGSVSGSGSTVVEVASTLSLRLPRWWGRYSQCKPNLVHLWHEVSVLGRWHFRLAARHSRQVMWCGSRASGVGLFAGMDVVVVCRVEGQRSFPIINNDAGPLIGNRIISSSPHGFMPFGSNLQQRAAWATTFFPAMTCALYGLRPLKRIWDGNGWTF